MKSHAKKNKKENNLKPEITTMFTRRTMKLPDAKKFIGNMTFSQTTMNCNQYAKLQTLIKKRCYIIRASKPITI